MPPDSSAAKHMRRALELAQLGWGRVHPNPMVGAVIVRDGAVVGEGYHQEYGGAHAEVVALRAAAAAARGATMYVTLEPCAHHGKTPPCTEAIIAAGIAAVVCAAADPNARARGGAALLRAAGIEVHIGLEEAAARALNAAFFHTHEHGAPYVALKLASTVDGRIAERYGARTALTGEAANREVQRLRAGHDAILIGSGTAAADDPLLTVRDLPVRTPPIRVIIDSDARIATTSRLVQTAAEAPLWIMAADNAVPARVGELTERGVRVLRVPRTQDGIDLMTALQTLATHGITSIFAEGGAHIATALLNAKLVQRMYLFVTPRLLGTGAVPAFAPGLRESGGWRLLRQQRFGDDVLLVLDAPEVR